MRFDSDLSSFFPSSPSRLQCNVLICRRLPPFGTELDAASAASNNHAERNAALHSQNGALHPQAQTQAPPPTQSHPFHFPKPAGKMPLAPRRGAPASAAELAVLADQNAELSTKVQDLQDDAARADAEARRRLKALEREIHTLKDELDGARASSERIEESLQSRAAVGAGGAQLDEELVKLWKKLAREAKVREMRAKTRPWEDGAGEGATETRDFAPGSASFASSSHAGPSHRPSSPPRPGAVGSPARALSPPLTPPSSYTPHPHSPAPALPAGPHERALVAQLLLKIRELEEANGTLAAEHLASRLRVRRAEQETEHAKQLLELTDDGEGGAASRGLEFEVVDGNDTRAEDGSATPRTIRLRSIPHKSSLHFDKARGASSPSQRGLSKHASMGDLAAAANGQAHPRFTFPKHGKMRGSVRGLFEDGASNHTQGVPTFGELPDDPHGSRMPSLGSELGGDLSGHGLRPSASHLHSKSIADLLESAEDEQEFEARQHGSHSPSSAAQERLLEARRAKYASLRHGLSRDDRDDDPLLHDSQHRRRHPSDSNRRSSASLKKPVLENVLMEVWLWLQFAIIVFVFVCSMARRGPASVIKNQNKTPHRRTT